jgi:hypothetical protein
MSERTTFEARLGSMFEAYAGNAPVEVDAATLASTIARRESRTVRVLGRNLIKPRWLTPLVVAVLLILALLASLVVGAALLRVRPPIYVPLSVRAAPFMSQQRGDAVAVRLNDGRVLVAGGRNGYTGGNVSYGELFDPVSVAFEATGSIDPIGISGQAATVLRDGRVLLTGGRDDAGYASSTVLLYDPSTESFEQLPDTLTPRARHASLLLPDGRVALVGGEDGPASPSHVGTEFYDPVSASFSPAATESRPRVTSVIAFAVDAAHVAVIARDAPFRPLIVDIATGSVNDPAEAASREGALLVTGAAQLQDGRIAVTETDPAHQGVGDALVAFDPASGSTAALATLDGKVVLGPVVLADGRLLFGTTVASDCTNVFADVFQPFDGSSSRIGQIGGIGTCEKAVGATITALTDGGALIAGGYMSYGGETSAATIVRP